jgi:hypothetical protein
VMFCFPKSAQTYSIDSLHWTCYFNCFCFLSCLLVLEAYLKILLRVNILLWCFIWYLVESIGYLWLLIINSENYIILLRQQVYVKLWCFCFCFGCCIIAVTVYYCGHVEHVTQNCFSFLSCFLVLAASLKSWLQIKILLRLRAKLLNYEK